MATTTRAERGQQAGCRRSTAGALLAGTALSLIALTGCSAPRSGTATAPAAAVAQTGSTATPAAVALRQRAVAATRALRSYTFASASVLGGHEVTLRGRAVLPDRLAFDVVSGIKHESVVRVGAARYVRINAGTWRPGTLQAAPDGSPLAGLIGALQASGSLTVDATGRLVGTISATDAAGSGLLKTGVGAAPITVAFTLDPAGHVTGFRMQTTLSTSGRALAFQQITSYGSFDHAAAVRKP